LLSSVGEGGIISSLDDDTPGILISCDFLCFLFFLLAIRVNLASLAKLATVNLRFCNRDPDGSADVGVSRLLGMILISLQLKSPL